MNGFRYIISSNNNNNKNNQNIQMRKFNEMMMNKWRHPWDHCLWFMQVLFQLKIIIIHLVVAVIESHFFFFLKYIWSWFDRHFYECPNAINHSSLRCMRFFLLSTTKFDFENWLSNIRLVCGWIYSYIEYWVDFVMQSNLYTKHISIQKYTHTQWTRLHCKIFNCESDK